MACPPTAYHDTARLLRIQLREACLDHDAFETRLRPCDLATCHATCCHDGAVLSEEEASTIRTLVRSHPGVFSTSGVANFAEPVTMRADVPMTATRRAAQHECADDFPSHFPRTRCVFLDREHKCALQLLSASLDHHPWFYKPISCWMHPILLSAAPDRDSRPTLTLLDPARDRKRFASCTHCGRPDPNGAPAREVLAVELAALSQLADRDFGAELDAFSSDSGPSR